MTRPKLDEHRATARSERGNRHWIYRKAAGRKGMQRLTQWDMVDFVDGDASLGSGYLHLWPFLNLRDESLHSMGTF
jgi:hypothetical protein